MKKRFGLALAMGALVAGMVPGAVAGSGQLVEVTAFCTGQHGVELEVDGGIITASEIQGVIEEAFANPECYDGQRGVTVTVWRKVEG